MFSKLRLLMGIAAFAFQELRRSKKEKETPSMVANPLIRPKILGDQFYVFSNRKPYSIDDFCGQSKGSFREFVKKEEQRNRHDAEFINRNRAFKFLKRIARRPRCFY